MTDYTKTTDFANKDGLAPGNPAKVIKGTEHDVEYNNIATHMATKPNALNGVHTGTTVVNILNATSIINATVDGGSY